MPESPTVLVIDDNRDHLAISATILSYAGYRCITAMDTHAGLKLAVEGQPDAILLDVQFGSEPNGILLYDELRNNPQTSHIPVLMMTAFGDVYQAELRQRGTMIVPKGDPTATVEHLRRILPIEPPSQELTDK